MISDYPTLCTEGGCCTHVFLCFRPNPEDVPIKNHHIIVKRPMGWLSPFPVNNDLFDPMQRFPQHVPGDYKDAFRYSKIQDYCKQFNGFAEASLENFDGYYFHIHRLLQLNLTFLHVSIPSCPHIAKCEFGSSIMLRKFSDDGHNPSNIHICGHYPEMAIFYPYSNAKIANRITLPEAFASYELTYTVIDQQWIKSVPRSDLLEANTILHAILFLQMWEGLFMFQIRVHSFQKISVSFNAAKLRHLDTFDGPGRKSQKISNNNENITSSAFVLFLAFYGELGAFTKYSCINISEKDIIVLQNSTESMQLPLVICYCGSHPVCLVEIIEANNHSIEVSISGFHHDGDLNSETCDYSGVSAYEKFDAEYEHIKTECVTLSTTKEYQSQCAQHESRTKMYLFNPAHHSEQFIGSQSLYSGSSILLLAWFSFREYSLMKVNVTVASSKCRVITIENCESRRSHWGPAPECTVHQYIPGWRRTSRNPTCMVLLNAALNTYFSWSATGTLYGECKQDQSG